MNPKEQIYNNEIKDLTRSQNENIIKYLKQLYASDDSKITIQNSKFNIVFQTICQRLITIGDFKSSEEAPIKQYTQLENHIKTNSKYLIFDKNYKYLSKRNATLTNITVVKMTSVYPTILYDAFITNEIKDLRLYGLREMYMWLYKNRKSIKSLSNDAYYSVKFILNGFYYAMLTNQMFQFQKDFKEYTDPYSRFFEEIYSKITLQNFVMWNIDTIILSLHDNTDLIDQLDTILYSKGVQFEIHTYDSKKLEVLFITNKTLKQKFGAETPSQLFIL